MAEHPPLTVPMLMEIVLSYYKGTSIRVLAKQYGYSYGGMHNILLREGVKFRKRGGPKGVEQ